MTATDRHNGSPTERTPVQFTLRSLLLAFVLVWASLALCGVMGLVLAGYLLAVVVGVRCYWAGYIKGRTCLASLSGLLLFIGFLLPAISPARINGRGPRCLNNLKQIGVALQIHESHRGHFPPACVADEDGKPMHSWRVLILPYIEHHNLYDQYNFDEPWDGPNNRKLAGMMPKVFMCPSDEGRGAPYTNYVAVVGPKTAWPEGGSVSTDDFPDGTANTLVVVEVDANEKFHWMEPRDLASDDIGGGIDPESGPGICSREHVHFGRGWVGSSCLFADGSIGRLRAGLDPETLEALLTIDGGEHVDLDDLKPKPKPLPAPRRTTWPVALAVLLVSFGLLLFWPLRKPADASQDTTHSAPSDGQSTAIADESLSELDESEPGDA